MQSSAFLTGVVRIGESSYMTVGLPQMASPRLMSPQMRVSMDHLQTPVIFRPQSNCDQRQETSAGSEPNKPVKESNASRGKVGKQLGLKLVDKGLKKKNELVRQSSQQSITKVDSVETDQLKRQKMRLQTQNNYLREQFQRTRAEERQAEAQKFRRSQILYEQRINQLTHHYLQSQKQREHQRTKIIQLQQMLKISHQQNMVLSHRVRQLSEINQRVQQVEMSYITLERQYERDNQEWKIEKKRLEMLNQ